MISVSRIECIAACNFFLLKMTSLDQENRWNEAQIGILASVIYQPVYSIQSVHMIKINTVELFSSFPVEHSL